MNLTGKDDPAASLAETLEVATQLTAITVKLDAILTGDRDHETRIRHLERALYLGIGASSTIGTLMGALISVAANKLFQ